MCVAHSVRLSLLRAERSDVLDPTCYGLDPSGCGLLGLAIDETGLTKNRP